MRWDRRGSPTDRNSGPANRQRTSVAHVDVTRADSIRASAEPNASQSGLSRDTLPRQARRSSGFPSLGRNTGIQWIGPAMENAECG